MTSPLRSRVVEAGARAMYDADDAYTDKWDQLDASEGVRDWYRRMFAAAFVGALDCLTENADELDDAVTNDGYWHLPQGQIEKMLAVLREDR